MKVYAKNAELVKSPMAKDGLNMLRLEIISKSRNHQMITVSCMLLNLFSRKVKRP
jgi:hypothetical protein